MENNEVEVEGMTVAVVDMESMCRFYENLFFVDFKEQEMFGAKLYSGKLGSLKLLFCPAELAQNTAVQNRHQLDIVVENLDETIQKLGKYKGEVMDEVSLDGKVKQVGIYDPDRNSITLKEILD